MEGVPGPGGRRRGGGLVAVAQRDVVDAVPLLAHEAGLQVELLEHAVADRRVARTALRGQIAVQRIEHRHQRRVVGSDLEVVQVGLVAVAGVDPGDRLVGAVDDDLIALAEALLGDAALPEGQHRRTVVLLDLEVRRLDAERERVEPHRLTAVVDDLRPVLPGTGVRRDEHVPGGRVRRVGRHRDRRGLQIGARDEVLHLARRPGGLTPGATDRDRVRRADGEAVGELAGGARGAHVTDDRDALAGGERAVGHVACAVALRVRLQASGVTAGPRAARRDVAQLRRRHAEQADLRARGGVERVRQRRGLDHRARNDVGAVECRGDASRGSRGLRRGGAEAEVARGARPGAEQQRQGAGHEGEGARARGQAGERCRAGAAGARAGRRDGGQREKPIGHWDTFANTDLAPKMRCAGRRAAISLR